MAREEFERQIAAEQSEQQIFFQKEEEKKRKIMERMKIIQQREAIQNFKVVELCRIFNVLQKCITILTYLSNDISRLKASPNYLSGIQK